MNELRVRLGVLLRELAAWTEGARTCLEFLPGKSGGGKRRRRMIGGETGLSAEEPEDRR